MLDDALNDGFAWLCRSDGLAGDCRVTRRGFLRSSALAAFAFGLSWHATEGVAQTPDAPPNIVFILADDMGFSDLSADGARGYETPVLDKLASEGVRFTQAYANSPVCSPSRVALLTGRYPGNFQAGLEEPNVRFALLGDAGYQTALVSKWHVSAVPEFNPTRYGYDSFFGIKGGSADYFLHRANQAPDKPMTGLFENDMPVKRDGYLTDIIADEAIKVIEGKSDQPLFLSVHFTAPHSPWEGPGDADRAATISATQDRNGGSVEIYANMMKSLDQNVGRVLDALDEAGLAENTLVVFTNDNGGERFSNNWPLIGYKGEVLEGGIRTPTIVRWPDVVPAGSTTEQVAISMDMMPTLLAAANASIPEDMEGMNLLPVLTGAGEVTERTLFWRMKSNGQAAVRHGDWKYVRIKQSEHLFDLAADQRERVDLAVVHPDILADLRQKFDDWNGRMLTYPEDSISSDVTRSGIYVDRYRPAGQ